MSLLHNSTTALLAAIGIALCAIDAGQRRDTALKLAGMAALGAAFMPSPALADQFIEASDGATIDCELARGELSRIALIDDGFANVSKIASGLPTPKVRASSRGSPSSRASGNTSRPSSSRARSW